MYGKGSWRMTHKPVDLPKCLSFKSSGIEIVERPMTFYYSFVDLQPTPEEWVFLLERVERKMKQIKNLSIIFVLLLLSACGNTSQETKVAPVKTEPVKVEAFPVTITDGANQKVTIPKQPTKIVSLIPSNTEIVYALGVGKNIIGVTNYDNYPEDVKTKEKIGDLKVNVEKVISLAPDLVLATSSMGTGGKVLDQIRAANIPVVVVEEAKSFDKVYHSIEVIGTVVGTKDQATNLVKEMKQKLTNIVEKAKTNSGEPAKVWVEVSPAPELYTAGKGTFINEMLSLVGAKNVAANLDGWPLVTEEDAVRFNPDVIITTYGDYVKDSEKQVMARPAWKDVPAVKNKRVTYVNADLMTRPGPRLVDGVEQLAKVIYPDVFK